MPMTQCAVAVQIAVTLRMVSAFARAPADPVLPVMPVTRAALSVNPRSQQRHAGGRVAWRSTPDAIRAGVATSADVQAPRR